MMRFACRGGAWALAAGLVWAGAPAAAVDVILTGTSTSGTVCASTTTGVTECDVTGMTPGQEVTFTWVLDSAHALNGYDLAVSWDPEELTPISCTELYPDSQPPGTVPFLTSPCPALPTDLPPRNATALSLVAFQTTALFSMTFQVTSVVLCDADGEADLAWSANGNGLSPGSVVLENTDGAGADFGVVLAACNDGLDNDGDTRIDFDGGACAGVAVPTVPDPQCTFPTRNREKNACGLGFELVLLLAPLLARRRALRS
jgi:hypothetical protein